MTKKFGVFLCLTVCYVQEVFRTEASNLATPSRHIIILCTLCTYCPRDRTDDVARHVTFAQITGCLVDYVGLLNRPDTVTRCVLVM